MMIDEPRAIATADLSRVVVDVATTAVRRARVRLAVQHSVTTDALSVVKDRSFTAASVRPEHSALDLFAAADLGGPVVGLTGTAGVILAINECVTTAA